MAMLTPARVTAQAEMLANRCAKRFRHLHPRMEREGVGAFRLYDRDIPEIRAVVDWYEGHLVVGEYARAQTDLVEDWVGTMARAVAAALGVAAEKVHVRARAPRPKEALRGERIVVREGPLRFYANLDDHLDTGLRTDHRITRAKVMAEARGRRMLNLFGSTGTFSVAAAKGGASETTTVDPSGRSLDVAEDNLALNGVAGPVNAVVRDDAVSFLARAAREGRRWDLIVLDPPSYSARGGSTDFDVQRDHRAMVEAALGVLSESGVLWFSTSHARFIPQLDALPARSVREVSAETIPEDHRNRGVHRCWRIER